MAELPRLLKLLAARTMCLLNYADLARDAGLPQTTLKRYVALLHGTFLVRLLPAWATNLTKRQVKSPKLLLADTGMALHLLGRDAFRFDDPMAGLLFEALVALELQSQADWSDASLQLHHFRTHTGKEVDLVIERADGAVVGVEVKLAGQVQPGDLKGLKALEEAAGERFVRGVMLYNGDRATSLSPRIDAVPIGCLWS